MALWIAVSLVVQVTVVTTIRIVRTPANLQTMTVSGRLSSVSSIRHVAYGVSTLMSKHFDKHYGEWLEVTIPCKCASKTAIRYNRPHVPSSSGISFTLVQNGPSICNCAKLL
jgi:hypothetical protein